MHVQFIQIHSDFRHLRELPKGHVGIAKLTWLCRQGRCGGTGRAGLLLDRESPITVIVHDSSRMFPGPFLLMSKSVHGTKFANLGMDCHWVDCIASLGHKLDGKGQRATNLQWFHMIYNCSIWLAALSHFLLMPGSTSMFHSLVNHHVWPFFWTSRGCEFFLVMLKKIFTENAGNAAVQVRCQGMVVSAWKKKTWAVSPTVVVYWGYQLYHLFWIIMGISP